MNKIKLIMLKAMELGLVGWLYVGLIGLKGKRYKIRKCRVFFVSTTKQYDWVPVQIDAVKAAFLLLDHLAAREFKSLVNKHIKRIVYIEGGAWGPEQFAGSTMGVQYVKGRSDHAVFLSSCLVMYASFAEDRNFPCLLRKKRPKEMQLDYLSVVPGGEIVKTWIEPGKLTSTTGGGSYQRAGLNS